MTSTVPRGTRTARLSVRVPSALKDDLRSIVGALQARGVRTSESELVEMLVADGLHATPAHLDARLRDWRMNS